MREDRTIKSQIAEDPCRDDWHAGIRAVDPLRARRRKRHRSAAFFRIGVASAFLARYA